MLVPFVKEEKILNQRPFIEDEVQFNVIHRISDDSSALLLRSEDNNVILARSSSRFPMWIWINSNSNHQGIGEIVEAINKNVLEETFELITTPEMMKEILNYYEGSYQKLMEMESFRCDRVIMPQSTSGVMAKPSIADIDTIAEYCVGFIYWGFGKEVSKESQLKDAERLINSGNLYVLKVNNEIVSMANIAHRAPRHGRINNVYTPPNHRKKGYASELVAYLSNAIMEEGLIPVLFTDLTNKTSNKVYKDVGYRECGKVDHYRITKKSSNIIQENI